MPATAAYAGIAASNAAIAAAEARRAEEAECRVYMMQFDSKHSTVPQQQQYAHCVQLTEPKETPHEVIVCGKVAVAIILLSMIYGFFKGFGYVADEGLEGALIGALGSTIALFVLLLLVAAVAFLFS